MSMSQTEIARRDGGQIVVRPSAVRMGWELSDLTTSDGFAARAALRASVRAVGDAAENRLLEEAFLSRSSIAFDADVAAHFSPALQSSARQFAAASEIAALLCDAGRMGLQEKLTQAARAVAFGCGLEILPPFELEIESATYTSRQRELRRAAEHTQRLDRAGEMFKQFQSLRQSAPELPVEKILASLSGVDPADQLELQRSLLLASARQTVGLPLWLVAGPHLIKVHPQAAESAQSPRTEVFTPPTALGPFRSVQHGELQGKTVLMVGARGGLLLIDSAVPAEATLYADQSVTSQLGFNAACIAAGKLWATHGEAGLVGWDLACPETCAVAIRAGSTLASPKNLVRVDDQRAVFSSGNQLWLIDADGQARAVSTALSAAIVSIVAAGDSICVVCEDGLIRQLDPRSLATLREARRSERLVAAGALPWLGTSRLLLATEFSSILCVGLEDEWAMQYLCSHSGLRQTAGAADRVAAISPDRHRVLLWSSWDGRQPVEIHMGSIARHRVADLEFA